ncbi:MAG: hypothetical protein K2X71_27605 [Methylobacterium sp.]|uniref:hypothetical protein n=1 Tax=Methylobacterium sp. TaxID=409 RepID=UPI00258D9D7A|nr:hypothetical protein [Methylobacterium sp.]MBY0299759.1 hypothetical protein [Methylobacterium sp.]
MQASPSARTASWGLLAILGAVNLAGYAFNLYERFWWFDRVLHATTILAITLWLSLTVFGPVLRAGPGHGWRILLLLASIGIAGGAVWEVAEWALDHAFPDDIIKGKYDTIVDVIMDTLGALLASGIALRCLTESRVHPE